MKFCKGEEERDKGKRGFEPHFTWHSTHRGSFGMVFLFLSFSLFFSFSPLINLDQELNGVSSI